MPIPPAKSVNVAHERVNSSPAPSIRFSPLPTAPFNPFTEEEGTSGSWKSDRALRLLGFGKPARRGLQADVDPSLTELPVADVSIDSDRFRDRGWEPGDRYHRTSYPPAVQHSRTPVGSPPSASARRDAQRSSEIESGASSDGSSDVWGNVRAPRRHGGGHHERDGRRRRCSCDRVTVKTGMGL